MSFKNKFNINSLRHDYYKNIKENLYRKVARYLRIINSYIKTLKSIFKRLINNFNLRDYKLLYKNSRYYDLRTYNYFILNKIIIA